MTGHLQGFLAKTIWLLLCAIPIAAVAQQRPANTGLHYVANTRPPDAFLALRTQPTSATGERIMAMPNGTPLRVLDRRADGWWRVKVEPSGQEGWALAYQGNRTWIECCLTTAASSAPQTDRPDGFKLLRQYPLPVVRHRNR